MLRRQLATPCRLLLVALIGGALLAACGDGDAERASSGPTPPPAIPTVTPAASPRAQAQAATATATTEPAAPTSTPRDAQATPTRTATAAATRTPARTPTPIPPPEPAIGDTVETDGWRITIDAFELYFTVGDSTAEGRYLYLWMTIENRAAEARAFPFDGLVVVDINEMTYFLAEPPTRETLTYDFGFDIDEALPSGATQQVAAVFDIAPDATGLILTTPSRVFQIRVEYDEAPK